MTDMANLFYRTGQNLTILSKLLLSGPLVLISAEIQSKCQKKVFTFDQHPKSLFLVKVQIED